MKHFMKTNCYRSGNLYTLIQRTFSRNQNVILMIGDGMDLKVSWFIGNLRKPSAKLHL